MLLQQAVKARSDLFRKVLPRDYSVSIAEHPSGLLAVTFPEGVPAYEFVNLVCWPNQPPEVKDVSGAAGWLTSPFSGLRYSLRPDTENDWGDTLIGTSSDGASVQVYLPEAAMCEVSRSAEHLPEPELAEFSIFSGVEFSVTLDADPAFGNPEFRITHPKDTDWDKLKGWMRAGALAPILRSPLFAAVCLPPEPICLSGSRVSRIKKIRCRYGRCMKKG